MPVIKRLLNGKMNLDVSNYAVPPGDFTDALNITRDSKGEAQDKIVANINGNTLVSYTLPSGQNKVIGSFADLIRNRVYYFVWNSIGKNSLLYFDSNSGTITKVIEDLTDTAGLHVLSFNPSKKVNHVDVINRDVEGDLLFFTDGNSTPKCVNVLKILSATYSVVKSSFVETAKKPFLTSPICTYGTDATRLSNSLRRKLFQFSARPVYDDFQKTTLSTYSKIPLPIGYYGSDNDTETTKNNFITVTIETGDENVSKLEIFMRSNNGNNWNDFVQIASLDKSELLIPDNTTYDFLFYNDGIYPPIDINEAIRLWNYVPPLADCQVLGNGNIPIYGAITEGFANYPVSQLDVTISAVNKTNLPPDSNPASITYTQVGNLFTFTVAGTITPGTIYTVAAFINYAFPTPPTTITLAQYTCILGDTTTTIATAMYNYIVANTPTLAGGHVGPAFSANLPSGSFITHIDINAPSPGGSTISTEKTWLPNCNYVFGIVYVDEQNRDMPGVTTFSNPTDSANDFLVTTPSTSLDGSNNIQTAVITASINHTPPAGAKAFYWVRRRMTYSDFLFYETCDYQFDTNYLWFCLSNIDSFKSANSQFVYGTAPITTESRVKIMLGITSSAYNGNVWSQDYEILGVEKRTLTGGTSPTDDKMFIKVKKPSAVISPAYTSNMLVMVYTPAQNPLNASDSVFNEWGETYAIYESGGILYHNGKNQNQTISQPATFVWNEGDVYFRKRKMYRQLLSFPDSDADTVSVMDAGFSDYFISSVNDNGRAQIVDVNARKQFNPTLVRYGGAYESGTNINETNTFDSLWFDEYDRGRGAIRKLFLDKRRMAVFQQFDVGIVPVYTQIVRDTTGNPLEANSAQLLNKITYPYIGKFGIGDVPESFAYGKGGMYFVDSNKGVVCRLAQDGITPVSVVYDCNAFFVPRLASFGKGQDNGLPVPGLSYTGNPTVYGVFDSYTNKYILSLEQIDRYSSSTSLFSTSFTTGGIDGGVAFAGTVTSGLTITVIIQASNGQSLTVSYVTIGGDTKTTIRNSISALVNASPTFTSTTFNLSSFDGFPTSAGAYPGARFHNIAGATTTAIAYISGALIFHQNAITVSFNETRDSMEGFESFYSFYPEGMISLNNLLISFKNGSFWRHDSSTFNNFYGVQYGSSITPCFNDNVDIKKTFERISYQGNQIWVSDTDADINTSDTNPQTNLPQISKLRDFDYTVDENVKYAAFLRDINSNSVALEGLYSGDLLKGTWIEVKLKYTGGSYAFIHIPRVGYSISQKNS